MTIFWTEFDVVVTLLDHLPEFGGVRAKRAGNRVGSGEAVAIVEEDL